MIPANPVTTASLCADCGGRVAANDLACGGCGALRHAAQLQQLATEAKAAQTRGDLTGAKAAWSQALSLLPAGIVQYQSIEARIQEIDSALAQRAAENPQSGKPMAKWAARLGPLGVALWKAKFVGLLVLGKAKLVLLGLTKLTTLTTMAASFLWYWHWYGWAFALGLVVSIFIHEMGHVLELKKFGIPASAPMFIPGFGALVMLKQRPATAAQDARVGLAGPLFGLGAAAFAFAIYKTTGAPLWAALAHFGAWINLFNLIPVWQLDGGRGFAALTRQQRGIILALTAGLFLWTNDGVLFLVALGCGYRLFTKDAPAFADQPVMWRFIALLVTLGLLATVGGSMLPQANS